MSDVTKYRVGTRHKHWHLSDLFYKSSAWKQSRYIAASNYFTVDGKRTLHGYPRIPWTRDLLINRGTCYMQLIQTKMMFKL